MEPWEISKRERVAFANAQRSPRQRAARAVVGAVIGGVIAWAIFAALGRPEAFADEWVFVVAVVCVAVGSAIYDWAED